MAAKDVCGVAVRIAGLVFVVLSFFDMIHAIATALDLPLPSRYSIETVLLAGGCYLLVGVLLLAGARVITNLLYGKSGPGN